jgi:hypothetical protein
VILIFVNAACGERDVHDAGNTGEGAMMRKDPAMRAFVIHLAIFVLVVVGLAAINLLRRPDHIWFIWVLAGWGIGLAAHDLALLLARTPRREAIFTDPAVRGFFIHALVFVAVNALLIVVNLIASPGFYWFYWPLLGWGIVLAAHGYLVFRRRGTSAKSPSPALATTGAKTGAKSMTKTKAKPGTKTGAKK